MYNTEKKKLLLDLFEKNQNKKYPATTLVEDLKDEMNKATIYRQLQKLEQAKIIRKIYNEKIKAYEYQYSYNCSEHLHLKCIKCGNIIHLSCNEANIFINHILNNHGFSINQFTSSINGICKECI